MSSVCARPETQAKPRFIDIKFKKTLISNSDTNIWIDKDFGSFKVWITLLNFFSPLPVKFREKQLKQVCTSTYEVMVHVWTCFLLSLSPRCLWSFGFTSLFDISSNNRPTQVKQGKPCKTTLKLTLFKQYVHYEKKDETKSRMLRRWQWR